MTTDGLGRSTAATPRPVGRRGMVHEQRTHATPAARRTLCHVAPKAHHTRMRYHKLTNSQTHEPTIQPANSLVFGGYSSTGQSIRLSTGRLRVQLPLASFARSVARPASGAHAVLHHPAPEVIPRRRSSADKSTWLRTRGSGVRISPTACASRRTSIGGGVSSSAQGVVNP